MGPNIGSKAELIETIKYFRDLYDLERQMNLALTRDTGMMLANTGLGLISLATLPKKATR